MQQSTIESEMAGANGAAGARGHGIGEETMVRAVLSERTGIVGQSMREMERR
jgi:hypothetical protein